MLAKLRLDQTATYEKLVGAHEISKMLVSFVLGQAHPIGIGAEQGGIEKWDDFVIQGNPKFRIHIQIKRQTDKFGSDLDECERNTITRQNNNVELRDLSELDKTIKSLGDWIKNKKENDEYERIFCLELYDVGVQIKKDFKVRDLANILETHIKPDTSTSEELEELSKQDGVMKKCDLWLRSWCDIESYEQMLSLLKILKIKIGNTETVLKAETKDVLKRIFTDASLDEVHSKVVSYTSENATFTGAIQPRHLLHVLKDHLRAEVAGWTQFQTNEHGWNISGIHDLEDNNEIERPSVVVPLLWQTGNSNARVLKVDGECSENCKIAKSLMRLSLHPQGSFDIHCSDKAGWENSIKIKTGGTLGFSRNDLDDSRILDGLDSVSQSQSKKLTTIDEQERFAEELNNEMYKKTFALIGNEMLSVIRDMNSGDLRTKVEGRWNVWKSLLENNIEEQRKLFSKMLHPKAEGVAISGELRVGLKIVSLIQEALFLLLIVSVCLSDDDHENSWESVTKALKVTSIGLAFWSGSASGSKKVIEIDDESSIGKLLENESGQIIIIAKSKLSDREVFKDDMSCDIDKIKLLTHPRYPKLLVTRDTKFNRLLKAGSIQAIKDYFQEKLNIYNTVIEKAINEVVT
ncbi:MAG: hypothetical protein KAJ18_01895 [Candidatus Omnitrophica bacterium]|nr:hypothetical protein [Candidatus Omnitrophota bacterium]